MQGLAHCFEKSDEGKLVEKHVIEPLSAASLECLATGEGGRGGERRAMRWLMCHCKRCSYMHLHIQKQD